MVTYYNKKDLVSFGNYILEKYNVKKNLSSTPGEEVLHPRSVHDADLANWKDKIKK